MRLFNGEIIEATAEEKRWNWYFVRLHHLMLKIKFYCYPAPSNYDKQDYQKFHDFLDKALKKGFPIDFKGVSKIEGLYTTVREQGTLLEFILNEDRCPLDLAANIIKDLIEAGADVNQVNRYNQNALMKICRTAISRVKEYVGDPIFTDLFYFVLNKTSAEEINRKDHVGYTALETLAYAYVAYGDNAMPYIKTLLDAGADPGEESYLKKWDWSLNIKEIDQNPAMKERWENLQNYLASYQERKEQLSNKNSTIYYDYEL